MVDRLDRDARRFDLGGDLRVCARDGAADGYELYAAGFGILLWLYSHSLRPASALLSPAVSLDLYLFRAAIRAA